MFYNPIQLSGWGLTSFGGKKATKLQKVNLNVINPEDCKKKEPKVTNGNICTYTPGKDSCQVKKQNFYYLISINSKL